MQENVLWYQDLGMGDVDRVGGKNASLGEMISNLENLGVQVPGGFATTSFAFNEFLEQSGVNDKIYALLDTLDVDDIAALTDCGEKIRQQHLCSSQCEDRRERRDGCRNLSRLFCGSR